MTEFLKWNELKNRSGEGKVELDDYYNCFFNVYVKDEIVYLYQILYDNETYYNGDLTLKFSKEYIDDAGLIGRFIN